MCYLVVVRVFIPSFQLSGALRDILFTVCPPSPCPLPLADTHSKIGEGSNMGRWCLFYSVKHSFAWAIPRTVRSYKNHFYLKLHLLSAKQNSHLIVTRLLIPCVCVFHLTQNLMEKSDSLHLLLHFNP